MNSSNIDRFEKYMAEELNAEELNDFILELKSSVKFRSEYYSFRAAVKELGEERGLYTARKAAVLLPRDINDSEVKSKPAKIRRLAFRLISAAAIVATLIISGNTFYNYLSTPKAILGDVAALHPKIHLFSIKTLSTNDQVIETNFELLLEKAKDAYGNEDWSTAKNLFDKCINTQGVVGKNDRLDLMIYLYAGRAALLAGEHDYSINQLSKIKDIDNNSLKGLKELASWQLSLTYRAKKEIELEIKTLNDIKEVRNKTINKAVNKRLEKIILEKGK